MSSWKYILIPIISVVTAQLLKFTMESLKTKKLKWGRLFNGTGGMPSSHTVYTFSLTTVMGIEEGLTSPLFAICLIFSCIVAYDAMGLRMESGRQAEAINALYDKIFEGDLKQGMTHLKEELGHKPIEVIVGIIYAIVIATIFAQII